MEQSINPIRTKESKLAELAKTIPFALEISEIYHKEEFSGKDLPVNGDKKLSKEGFAEHLYHLLPHLKKLPDKYPEKVITLYEGIPSEIRTSLDLKYF